MRWALLLAALLIALLAALGMGAEWISPLSPATDADRMILWELRLPRVLTALAVGGLLALAGAWFQVLLGNPLAEPYVLGVAGSASVGAVASLILAPDSPALMSLGAFVGSWLGIVVVLRFAALGPGRMLLAGVVLAAFWSALLALLLALLPERGLYQAWGWMMGDLARGTFSPWLLLGALTAAVAAGLVFARMLDALLLGDTHARALGVDTARLRRELLLLASAATAVAVSAAGTIGFVGLVVPHLMRLVFGPLHRMLLPAAAAGGGMLLVLADAGARTILAPAELPVGVLTAIIGVPVFLYLLLRRSG